MLLILSRTAARSLVMLGCFLVFRIKLISLQEPVNPSKCHPGPMLLSSREHEVEPVQGVMDVNNILDQKLTFYTTWPPS